MDTLTEEQLQAVKYYRFYIPQAKLELIDMDAVRRSNITTPDDIPKDLIDPQMAPEALESTVNTILDEITQTGFLSLSIDDKMALLNAANRRSHLDVIIDRAALVNYTLKTLNSATQLDEANETLYLNDYVTALFPELDVTELAEKAMAVYFEVNKAMHSRGFTHTESRISEALLYQVGLLQLCPLVFLRKLIIALVFEPRL